MCSAHYRAVCICSGKREWHDLRVGSNSSLTAHLCAKFMLLVFLRLSSFRLTCKQCDHDVLYEMTTTSVVISRFLSSQRGRRGDSMDDLLRILRIVSDGIFLTAVATFSKKNLR